MFALFFSGLQQDIKISLFAPVVCLIFRAIFIRVYHPGIEIGRDRKKLWACFNYGFWWGLDFNAYVFLVSMLCVSLPGAFFPAWYAAGDTLRLYGLLVYLAVLLAAFIGRMIFYYHYHDIYNYILWLGKNADKKNLLDIFFRQDHGLLCILSFVPYLFIWNRLIQKVLALPVLPLPVFESAFLQYAFNALVTLGAVALFYFCRFGGTFNHSKKPEWDEVPTIVKSDVVLGKAAVDDLVALEMVWKRKLNSYFSHTDEEAKGKIDAVMPPKWQNGRWQALDNPLLAFTRKAEGARIKKPPHIFYIIAESYSEVAFDELYAELNIANGCKSLRAEEHSFFLRNFLSAGTLSQASIVALLSGIYDPGIEMNELKDFWQGTLPTALPVQFRKLGYRTVFWYGGALNWASLQHYLPGVGFDEAYGAKDFCPPDTPKTWLGVYDHIFLEQAGKMLQEQDDGKPVLHVLYTTSYHGPYRIPVDNYGYDFSRAVPERVQKRAEKSPMIKKKIGCFWYMDKAIADFCRRMREQYPDSLFVITGDHTADFPFDTGIIDRTEAGLRERVSTAFSLHHPELSPEMFAGNTIGGHMNLLPTLVELIAPAGHEYCSLFEPLTGKLELAVTPNYWLTEEEIGSFADDIHEGLGRAAEKPESVPGTPAEVLAAREGWCELSAYIARHTELLQNADKISNKEKGEEHK